MNETEKVKNNNLIANTFYVCEWFDCAVLTSNFSKKRKEPIFLQDVKPSFLTVVGNSELTTDILLSKFIGNIQKNTLADVVTVILYSFTIPTMDFSVKVSHEVIMSQFFKCLQSEKVIVKGTFSVNVTDTQKQKVLN